MNTRPCAGGHLTIIADASGPIVAEWGATVKDAEAEAGSAHMRMMERAEEDQARLAVEFAKQALVEFLKIRARA